MRLINAVREINAEGGDPIETVALFTDGEENGLLGAAAYLRDSHARASTGAVINMEARGNQGPSYLFQTGPGDARLIDMYARAVPHYLSLRRRGLRPLATVVAGRHGRRHARSGGHRRASHLW